MANALQLRRGTTAQHSTFTGLAGEVTVDTTKNTIVVHDGSTAGGHPLASSLSALGITASAADLNTTDVTTLGTVEASKVVTADANGDVTVPDDEILRIGTGGDLKIYHSSSNNNSYISEIGTGDLNISGTILTLKAANNEPYIRCVEDSYVRLYHDNLPRIETTSGGADISGRLTADDITTQSTNPDLEVIGDGDGFPTLRMRRQNGVTKTDHAYYWRLFSGGQLSLVDETNSNANRMVLDTNGDIKFYDTSGNDNFFWDASASELGINTTTPTAGIDINANGAGGKVGLHVNKDDTTGYYVTFEADYAVNSNRTLSLAPPAADDGNEPFTWVTGNAIAWEIDGVVAAKINSGGEFIFTHSPRETTYTLTGTDIDPANGGVQSKTLSANTTFTESLSAGNSVVLHLSGGASYTVTWPTMTWVGPSGNTAPTLTANDVIVIWQVGTTVYGAHVGSAA